MELSTTVDFSENNSHFFDARYYGSHSVVTELRTLGFRKVKFLIKQDESGFSCAASLKTRDRSNKIKVPDELRLRMMALINLLFTSLESCMIRGLQPAEKTPVYRIVLDVVSETVTLSYAGITGGPHVESIVCSVGALHTPFLQIKKHFTKACISACKNIGRYPKNQNFSSTAVHGEYGHPDVKE